MPIPSDAVIITPRGALGAFDGRLTVEYRTVYVMTASTDRLRDGFPLWHFRSGVPIVHRYRGSLGDIRGGRAKIYGLNPVYIFPKRGQFTLGSHGHLAEITSDFRGTFEDFAMTPVDPAWTDATEGDPAEAFVAAETSPTTAQGIAGTAWARHFRVMYPPKNARYAVPHIRTGVEATLKSQFLDAFQMEVLPTGSPATPTAFVPPRQVKVRVKPTRLNLSINPSFTSISNLTASNLTPLPDATYAWAGGTGLRVSVPTGASEVTLTEQQSIEVVAGEPLTVSLRSYVPTILTGSYRLRVDFLTEAGAAVSTVLSTDVIHNASIFPWDVKHLSTIVPEFATRAEVYTVHADSGPASGTDVFWIDAVLIEKSREVGEFFDGDSGDDYLWKQGLPGNRGLTWSYYYEDRAKRHYILERTLRENVPLGITITDPEYADGLLTVIRYGYSQYGAGPYGG